MLNHCVAALKEIRETEWNIQLQILQLAPIHTSADAPADHGCCILPGIF